jgi:hypothetical protein
MSHAKRQHPNAPLTPDSRRRMVASVPDEDWTIEATADRFQVGGVLITSRMRRRSQHRRCKKSCTLSGSGVSIVVIGGRPIRFATINATGRAR